MHRSHPTRILGLLLSGACLSGCGAGAVESDQLTDNPPVEVLERGAALPDVPMCGQMQLQPESTAPNLLLVVDRSGSMRHPIAETSTQSKIDDTRAALGLLLDQGDGSINFGLLTYPDNGSCGGGSISVGCAESSVPTIKSRIDALTADGGTPTGPALALAADYAPLQDESRQSFVVLLTDGKPTCPDGGGSEETDSDARAAVDAAAALHRQAVDAFVVGIGQDLNAANPQVLNDMAVAGGRPRAGAVKYYQANSLSQLNLVLSDISAAVFGCTFTLNPRPEDPGALWVQFDEQLVVKDPEHQNGWDYDAERNQVTAYGAACTLLQSGQVQEVEIWMGCVEEVSWDPPV